MITKEEAMKIKDYKCKCGREDFFSLLMQIIDKYKTESEE